MEHTLGECPLIETVDSTKVMEPRTADEIIAVQKRRTAFLVDPQRSPIPRQAIENGFKGLEYFPIDSKYQLKLKLVKYDRPETVPISLSNGTVVKALKFGHLDFELDGKELTLQVYKKKLEDTDVLVPMRDKTSGNETYGAGRYVDVDVEPVDDGCVLDFNLAYNPLCAFNNDGRFDCPLPPKENWLMNIEIRAGEKKFEY